MLKIIGTALAALVAAVALLLGGGVALADPGPDQNPGTSQECANDPFPGYSHGGCTSHYQSRDNISNALAASGCQSSQPPQGQTCVAPGQFR